ncbi:MAG: hypothetical protein WD030_03420 [Pirellulales bacterium]
MSSSQSVIVQAIGDFSPPEFHAAAELLRGPCDVVFDATPGAACERVFHARRWPTIVVVAQSRPGEIDATGLSRLQQLAPLARFIALLGPWCEGEARSGAPWPGMLRTYWHQWTARWAGELLCAGGGALPSWSHAASSPPEDRLLARVRSPRPRRPGLIAVAGGVYDTADMLCDACESLGYSACWLGRDGARLARGVSLVIWDGLAKESQAIGQLAARFPRVPLLVALDFPRHGDTEQLRQAGVCGVLSKPFLLEELAWHVDRAWDSPRQTADRAVA